MFKRLTKSYTPWQEYLSTCHGRSREFVPSQFAYCPLIWLFHSKQINHKINKLHERALRIVYNNHFSLFEELLSKGKSVTVQQRNLQMLAAEMYKILNGLSPDIMQDIFETKINYYNIRNAPAFSSRNIKTDTITDHLLHGSKNLGLVPKEMKQVTTLNEFKAKIKIWKLENCPC